MWEPRAGRVTRVERDPAQRGGLCHQAVGTRLLVGGDCWQPGLLARPLGRPLDWHHLVDFVRADGREPAWQYDLHASQDVFLLRVPDCIHERLAYNR